MYAIWAVMPTELVIWADMSNDVLSVPHMEHCILPTLALFEQTAGSAEAKPVNMEVEQSSGGAQAQPDDLIDMEDQAVVDQLLNGSMESGELDSDGEEASTYDVWLNCPNDDSTVPLLPETRN